MLDHAISITHADRGLLIEPDAAGALRVHLARSNKGDNLAAGDPQPQPDRDPSGDQQQSSVITEDLNLAGLDLKAAESIVVQGLRAVVAIPLYASSRATADTGARRSSAASCWASSISIRAASRPSPRSTARFSTRSAVQAASILDNARLVERERERQRLEQELSIARTIQQALAAARPARFSASRRHRRALSLPLKWAATTSMWFR